MTEQDCLMLLYTHEEQNITKAADRLFITQPALTYRLQQLEREYGVKIVTKEGKSIRFTREGSYLVTCAKRMLAEIRKSKDFLQSMSTEVQGTLRIGVAKYFAHYKLPPILKQMLELYPKIEIHVTTGFGTDTFNDLRNDEIHVAIVRGDFRWDEHNYLIDLENICMISKHEISLADLPGLPRINCGSDPRISPRVFEHLSSSLSKRVEHWWYERFTVPPFVTMQVDTYETCKEMVKNDLGYAIVPRICLSPHDNLYSLDLTMLNGEPITRRTWMLYKESVAQLTTVKRFVDFIKMYHLREG